MQLKYIGDNIELYGRTFDVLEEFEHSYYINADGVKMRVSIHDVELKEEDYGKRAMDN